MQERRRRQCRRSPTCLVDRVHVLDLVGNDRSCKDCMHHHAMWHAGVLPRGTAQRRRGRPAPGGSRPRRPSPASGPKSGCSRTVLDSASTSHLLVLRLSLWPPRSRPAIFGQNDRRKCQAQQLKNASPWAYFGWGFVNLPRERRGAHRAPRSKFFTLFRLGKPKNIWIRCQKKLEKAKRAFRGSKKIAPS